jgi:uncharacterized Zn finger protein
MEFGMGHYDYGGWPPYVSVAELRRNAARKLDALKKKGKVCQPVTIEGRTIARTFWGKNWCKNLEAYSDYANRLPRGRSYARNGSVIDLRVAAGKIDALVVGSEVYKISIGVHSLGQNIWQDIFKECAGKIASLVELLQGHLSNAVMEVVTRRGSGLFPSPEQIDFRCSCPDSASMCKHVAAVLYGIGARLDAQPELLFLLRDVDPQKLIGQTASLIGADATDALGENQRLETTDLSTLFGIQLDEAPATTVPSFFSPGKSDAIVQGRPVAKKTLPVVKAASKVNLMPDAPRISPAKATLTPNRAKTVTARALAMRTIPYHMMQSWLNSGVLLRTEKRGVYRVTKWTEKEIEKYLERPKTSARSARRDKRSSHTSANRKQD